MKYKQASNMELSENGSQGREAVPLKCASSCIFYPIVCCSRWQGSMNVLWDEKVKKKWNLEFPARVEWLENVK